MRRLFKLFSIIGFTFALLAPAAQAAPRERCFAETGYCVSGALLEYWERNGGLPVFGYPIGPQRTETVEGSWSGPVQWFERDRLENHSNAGQDVLAGRLGARYLELSGRPWTKGDDRLQGPANACAHFDQTGYALCAPFRDYWDRHGGLARFGYPITGVIEERIEGTIYQVQYFERRRMEYHPEHRGTPYEMQLGLLGRDVAQMEGASGGKPAIGALTITPSQPMGPGGDPIRRMVYSGATVTLTVTRVEHAARTRRRGVAWSFS